MADTKITALTAITTVDPAVDVLPIVDVSDTTMAASGTTKKITSNQILGAGGTATLASATITGDLTVDTSTLKVDSANNRVGIGTASPSTTLTVGAASPIIRILDTNTSVAGGVYGAIDWLSSDSSMSGLAAKIDAFDDGGSYGDRAALRFFTHDASANTEKYRIASNGIATWSNVGGVAGTAMTLNATGLGVGDVPTADCKLTVRGGAFINRGAAGGASQLLVSLAASSGGNFGQISNTGTRWALGYGSTLTTVGTEALIWDSSGNVGIGVTPSAGGSNYYKTLEIGKAGCGLFTATASLSGSELTYLSGNGVLAYNAGPEWTYGNNGAAAIYGIEDGVHKWYNATTGTAGVVFTPTQAMTLDASGNLLVGKTAVGFGTVGVESSSSGLLVATRSASTDGASATMMVYSTGAAAYRFYVGMGGTVFATNTTISAISDARLKENVQDIDVGLGAILALKPRKFDWKAGKGKDIKGDRGFIAQEFEQVFPQLVDEWKDAVPEGEAPYKSVRQDLIPVLVKAIQELTARVQTLETR